RQDPGDPVKGGARDGARADAAEVDATCPPGRDVREGDGPQRKGQHEDRRRLHATSLAHTLGVPPPTAPSTKNGHPGHVRLSGVGAQEGAWLPRGGSWVVACAPRRWPSS